MATVSKVYVGDSEGYAKQIYPPPVPRTMTARFNLSDSNPATWGEYLDDAVDMTAGSADWDEFFGHFPAMIKNGEIVGELDPAQGYAKYMDGTTADITSGDEGDVMIVFPRRDLRIWSDSGYMYVSMTEELGKTDYSHLAHRYLTAECDWFALGRYKGSWDANSKLRSLSGKSPAFNQTIGTHRTRAQSNGAGYEQSAFYQLTYRQAMYMLKYLGQNAQIAIGRGFVDGNTGRYQSGFTDNKGMDWGESTGKFPMTLFGIENFYGNLNEFIDGIITNTYRKFFAKSGDYNDTGAGYGGITTKTANSNYSGYMKTPALEATGSGFLPDVSTRSNYGSASTYFCDNSEVGSAKMPYFGGTYNQADQCGVFCLVFGADASSSMATIGSRLMFMHTV